MGNTKVKEERETAIGRMCVAVFGEGFKGFNIAHLVTTDGIGVEMFEMKERQERQERQEVDFTRLGIFHFCLQTDDHFTSKVLLHVLNNMVVKCVWTLCATTQKTTVSKQKWFT